MYDKRRERTEGLPSELEGYGACHSTEEKKEPDASFRVLPGSVSLQKEASPAICATHQVTKAKDAYMNPVS